MKVLIRRCTMKHIKLIEDEQLLEQISGGKAAAPVKAMLVVRRRCGGLLELAALRSGWGKKAQYASY
jgi:hypothetical protein